MTAIGMDMIPRTISRAQSFDTLSSQANIAGYRAVIEAGPSSWSTSWCILFHYAYLCGQALHWSLRTDAGVLHD